MVKNRRYQSKRKKKFPLKWLLIGGLFFCFLAAAAYFSIWHSYFWIKQIKVESDREPIYFQPEQIEELAKAELGREFKGIIPLKSVFWFPVGRLVDSAYARFPGIASIEVERRLPDQLAVKVSQRQKIGIWCQAEYRKVLLEESQPTSTPDELIQEEETEAGRKIEQLQERRLGDCFEIDQQGIIFKKSPLVKGEMILNVYSQNGETAVPSQVLTPELTNFIDSTYHRLKQVRTIDSQKLRASEFEVFSVEDIRTETSYGWKIYFNPAVPLDSQINALTRVLSEEIGKDYSALEYMDLRIKGRVYYK